VTNYQIKVYVACFVKLQVKLALVIQDTQLFCYDGWWWRMCTELYWNCSTWTL